MASKVCLPRPGLCAAAVTHRAICHINAGSAQSPEPSNHSRPQLGRAPRPQRRPRLPPAHITMTTPDIYQLALTITTGDAAETIRASDPASIVATVTTARPRNPARCSRARRCSSGHPQPHREATRRSCPLRNGNFSPAAQAPRLLKLGRRPAPRTYRFRGTIQHLDPLRPKLILKFFRRLQPGENPDTEMDAS